MKISDFNNNNFYCNNFKSVNQRFMKEAIDENKIMNTISGDLIEKLQFSILTKRLSKQDGLDTIEAIRPLAKKKYQFFLDTLVEMCQKIKN